MATKHKKPAPAAKKTKHKPAKKPAPAKKAKPAAKAKPPSKAKPSSKVKTSSKSSAKAAKPAPKKAAPKPVAKKPAKPVHAAKAKAPVKPAAAAKHAVVAKHAAAKHAVAKPVAAKPAAHKAPAHAPAAKPAAHGKAHAPEAKPKAAAKESLRSKILNKIARPPQKPIAFSLDEVREIAKVSKDEAAASPSKSAAKQAKIAAFEAAKPRAPHHVAAASLADILGFNPRSNKKHSHEDDSLIPEKFRRYYKILIELRNHVTGQLDTHTEETLKRSAKDDAGDLSSYGQHMADAGTDTFDRDFALSLVSSEQEALSEIEAAIQRIKAGNYGVCEVTAKPIARDRLIAVPFTRYSAEAQKEIEKNRIRHRSQSSLFAEAEEGGKMMEEGGDE